MSDEIESGPSEQASGDGAANDVHIHKPKAANSLREFLAEIIVIVVGIVIALGLEQTVEWLHTQSEVAETREALKAEITRNAAIALQGSAEDKCLFAATKKFIAWAKGGPRPPIYYPHRTDLQFAVWDLSKGGAVNHMPLKERAGLANYYSSVSIFNENRSLQKQTSVVNASLMTLHNLNPAQAQRLVAGMLSAAVLDRYQWGNADYVVQLSRELGATPPPVSASDNGELAQFCRAVGGPSPAG